jgi:hypothetical protein
VTSGAADELEEKYGLLYCIEDREHMVEKTKKKIDELLSKENIQEIGREKQKKLLEDKKDFNKWWVDYLEKEVK